MPGSGNRGLSGWRAARHSLNSRWSPQEYFAYFTETAVTIPGLPQALMLSREPNRAEIKTSSCDYLACSKPTWHLTKVTVPFDAQGGSRPGMPFLCVGRRCRPCAIVRHTLRHRRIHAANVEIPLWEGDFDPGFS